MATQFSAVNSMARAARRVSARQVESAWNEFLSGKPTSFRRPKAELEGMFDKIVDFVGPHSDGTFKFVDSGYENAVFDIGEDKVLKILHNQDVTPYAVPKLSEVLQPLESSSDLKMHIFPWAHDAESFHDGMRDMVGSLAKKGWAWTDMKSGNAGIVDGKLKIIDAGFMRNVKQEAAEHGLKLGKLKVDPIAHDFTAHLENRFGSFTATAEDFETPGRLAPKIPRASVKSPLNDQIRQAIADVRKGQTDARMMKAAGAPLQDITRGPMLGEMDAREELHYLLEDRRAARGLVSAHKPAIEGLRHGGSAEQMRKNLTSFGSGWQGIRKTVRGLESVLGKGNRRSVLEIAKEIGPFAKEHISYIGSGIEQSVFGLSKDHVVKIGKGVMTTPPPLKQFLQPVKSGQSSDLFYHVMPRIQKRQIFWDKYTTFQANLSKRIADAPREEVLQAFRNQLTSRGRKVSEQIMYQGYSFSDTNPGNLARYKGRDVVIDWGGARKLKRRPFASLRQEVRDVAAKSGLDSVDAEKAIRGSGFYHEPNTLTQMKAESAIESAVILQKASSPKRGARRIANGL